MRSERAGVGVGLFFVAAGVLFLLEGLDLIRLRAAYLWPVLLIGFGAALLIGGIRRRPSPEPAPAAAEPPPEPAEPRAEPDRPTDEEPPASEERPVDDEPGSEPRREAPP